MDKKVPFTVFQKILEALTLCLLLFLAGYLIMNWGNLPDRIPSHFDAMGNPNAWSGKNSILLLPIVSLGLYILITVISFFPQVWNTPVRITEKNYKFVYTSIRDLVSIVKFCMIASFTYMTIQTAMARPLSPWYLPIFLVLMFAPIAFIVVKIVKGNKKLNEEQTKAQ